MEPHPLATAVRNPVAQATIPSTSTTSRDTRAADKVSSNATGIDMEPSTTNNKIVDNAAGAHPSSSQSSGIDNTMARKDRDQDDLDQADSSLQITSSKNSQSTTDSHDIVSTPPTSASEAFSSQSTNADTQLSQLSQLSQLAAQQQPLSNEAPTRPSVSIPATAGQKRTADGQVKASSTSPDSPRPCGHSRNTSAVSNVSSVGSQRIGELSSELRTRLSYAMIKVNNGWQANTIDEVETLASQAGSPTSSTSTLHGRRTQLTSPRTAMAAVQQPSNMSSVSQAHTADFDLYSRNEPASRTYESFWRDHSTTSYPAQRTALPHGPITSPASASLEPPADIRPTPTSRRSGTPKFSKPPTVPNHGSNSPYTASAPRTPHRGEFRENASIQTPTQKTIQEQDAIETLLFMSSPGNSGNMGHTFPPPRNHGSPQQSPLRAEFNVRARVTPGRRVEFEPTATSRSTESSEAGAPEYRAQVRGKIAMRDRVRGQAIDRLLDEMGDSSSDEEEIPLNYSSPRRVAAGRV